MSKDKQDNPKPDEKLFVRRLKKGEKPMPDAVVKAMLAKLDKQHGTPKPKD